MTGYFNWFVTDVGVDFDKMKNRNGSGRFAGANLKQHTAQLVLMGVVNCSMLADRVGGKMFDYKTTRKNR